MNRLGIIVLNYNKYDLTLNAIENIKKISNDLRILVVDNNSTNNSFEIIKERIKNIKKINIIKNELNEGYAKGNNFGYLYFKRNNPEIKYIGIMNPDVELSSLDSIKKCINILSKKNEIATISPISVISKKLDYSSMAWKIPFGYQDIFNSLYILKFLRKNNYKKLDILYFDEDYYSEVEVLPGSFFIIKKEIFEKIGLFDSNTFLYCEERILGKKIKDLKLKQALLLSAYYYHNHEHKEADLKSSIFHVKELYKSRIYYNAVYNHKNGFLVSKILKILYPVKIFEIILKNYFKIIKNSIINKGAKK